VNYPITAPFKGKEYRANINLIMTGPWNIVNKARIEGKWWSTVSPIDFR
jgi:hypothetical protein